MRWFVLSRGYGNLQCGHALALEWACLAASVARAAGRRAAVVGKIGGRFVRVF